MPNVSLQRGAEAVGDGDFFLADLAVCWGDVIERPPATKKDVLAQLHLHAIAHLGWRCDGHGNTEERIHGLLRSPLETTQQIAATGTPGWLPVCQAADKVDRLRQVFMDWTEDAVAALKKDVPFFVRPAVRRRVEAMAAEDNRLSIDLMFYQQAKASMGPK